MRILVTGAAGFMGCWLADYLQDKGHEVFGADDLSGNANEIKSPLHMVDLRNKEITESFIKDVKPELVYHLAATAREGASHFDPANMVQRNIVTFANTIEASIKAGSLKRFVLFSSMAVYGNNTPPFFEAMPKHPVDIYGFCKLFMEESVEDLAKAHDFDYTVIRPHNVYGPKQCMWDRYRNVIMIWINSLLRGEKINIFGDGSHTRAFSYIEDSLPCYAEAGLQDDCKGMTINIGGKRACTLNELCDTILKAFFKTEDVTALKEKHVQYLPDRFQEVPNAFCTTCKSEQLLSYKDNFTLSQGIEKIIIWAKEQGPQEWTTYKLPLLNDKAPSVWHFDEEKK